METNTTTMEANITKCTNMTYFYRNEECLWYYSNKALFWVLVSILILVSIVGVLGNAIVIYAATKKKHMSGGFRYLNRAVRSLAITDLCLSLFGTPMAIVFWYWSKYFTLPT